MMFFCVEISTGKIVPFIDVCGNSWKFLRDRRVAARALHAMNREAGYNRYRVTSEKV